MSSELVTQKNYLDIHTFMQPGDIIAFGGDSLFSKWAKLTTQSAVTHIAVVLKSQLVDQNDGSYFNQVIEATEFNGKSGVMINRLCERIDTYDGDIWWLPLAEQSRNILTHKSTAFFDFLFQQEHKDFDIWQLFGSAVDVTDDVPLLKSISRNTPDFSSWFCSELAAEALHVAGVINDVNASEVTPIDICRFNIYAKEYVQLKGNARQITGINSLAADGWGRE